MRRERCPPRDPTDAQHASAQRADCRLNQGSTRPRRTA
jgi:hypothetical protein